MIKTVKKIILFLIIFCTIIIKVEASETANISISPTKTDIKAGEKLSVNIAIDSTNIEDGILNVYGVLDFDKEVLSIDPVDAEIDISGMNFSDEQREVIDAYSSEADVLYISDSYLIAGLEEDGAYGIVAVCVDESKVIKNVTSKKVIGNINFNVLKSAKTGTTQIKMLETTVNDEISIGQIQSTPISIKGSQMSSNATPNSNQVGTSLTSNYAVNNQQNDVGKANSSISKAGSIDMIPIILLIILLALTIFIKYKKIK